MGGQCREVGLLGFVAARGVHESIVGKIMIGGKDDPVGCSGETASKGGFACADGASEVNEGGLGVALCAVDNVVNGRGDGDGSWIGA